MSMPSNSQPASAVGELGRVLSLRSALIDLDPDFAELLSPCPAKEISKFEKAHGMPLPEWYRAYLESVGRGVDVVLHYGETDLRPKTLLSWMKRHEWRSARYFLVGVAALDSEFHVFVDLGEDGQGTEVVSFEYPQYPGETLTIRPVSSDFATYIVLALANRVRAEMPATGRLGAGNRAPGLLPALRRQLARFGVEEHPLSGTWDKLFVGPRVIAGGYEAGNEQSLSVSLGCMAVDEWWEIAGRLEHELKLRIVRSPG